PPPSSSYTLSLHDALPISGLQLAQVDLDLAAALEGNLDDAAFLGGGVVVARGIVAADHIENDIGARAIGHLAGAGDEILLAIIDRDIRAELHAGGAFLGAAGGDDDSGAERLGELDGGRTDARGAAMDEHRFAGG